jgi:hypothetical protein
MSQDPSILIPAYGPGRTRDLDNPAPAAGAVRMPGVWPARTPVGDAYARALVIWHHRLDRRSAANLARIAAVHAASAEGR